MQIPQPVDSSIEVIRHLLGHSGCRVALCRRGDVYFVRKFSASEAYNERLQSQLSKQERLSEMIRTPRIIEQGLQDGLIYFDMEFINGHSFGSYAPLQNVATLSDFARRILEPVRALAENRSGTISAATFRTKVESVSRAVAASAFYPSHRAILDRALASLDQADWSDIPCTASHGDLTLENMLVTEEGEIVLIDLLDGDLETVWLDVAKLLQDLESGWSLRGVLWKAELSANDRLMAMLSRYLYDEIRSQILVMFPQLAPKLSQLRVLQAMRVLPYVHDEITFRHVVRGLDRALVAGR